MSDTLAKPESMPIPIKQQEAMLNRCGQCKHAYIVSNDLREPLQCRYAPPCISSFMSPQGLLNITNYPQVRRDNAACAVGYTLKLALSQ